MSKRVVITSRTIRKRQQRAAEASKKPDKDEKDVATSSSSQTETSGTPSKGAAQGATSSPSKPGTSGTQTKDAATSSPTKAGPSGIPSKVAAQAGYSKAGPSGTQPKVTATSSPSKASCSGTRPKVAAHLTTSPPTKAGPTNTHRKTKSKKVVEDFLDEVLQASVVEANQLSSAETASKKSKRRPPKRVRRLVPFMPSIEEETDPVDAQGDRCRPSMEESYQGVKKRPPKEVPKSDTDDRVINAVRAIAHKTAQDAFQEMRRRMMVQEVARETITEITEHAIEEVAWDIAKMAVDEIGQEAERAAAWELSENSVYLMSQTVVEQVAWDVDTMSLADEVGQEAVDESAGRSAESSPSQLLVVCRGEEAAEQFVKIAKKLGRNVMELTVEEASQLTSEEATPPPSQTVAKRGSSRRRRRKKNEKKVAEEEEYEEELIDDINLGPCYYQNRTVQKAEPGLALDDAPYPDSAARCSHPPPVFREPEPEPEGAYGGPATPGNVFHNLLHEFWNTSREQLELDGYVFEARVVYKLGLRAENREQCSEVSFNLFTEEPDPELIEKHIRVADAILDYIVCKKRKENEKEKGMLMLAVGYEITPYRNKDLRRIEREIRDITADGLQWAMSVILKNVGPVHKLKISCTIEHEKLYLSDLRDLIESSALVDKVHIDRIQMFRM